MNPLHYPSLELCKKLTEFGFPETAINYEQLKTDEESDFTIGYTAKSSAYNIYRCPSVMELLDETPLSIDVPLEYDCGMEFGGMQNLQISFDDGVIVSYVNKHGDGDGKRNESLPNALAEMYLWLKENNYLPTK